MASPKAKAGASKGTTGKGKKGAAKPVKANPKPKATPPKKNKRVPGGKTKEGQATFLETVKESFPGITSEKFAFKFNVAFIDQDRMRAFALEYLKDYDLKMAAIRCNYPPDSAYDCGKLLFNNAFTQLYISEIRQELRIDQLIDTGALIAAYWEEAKRPDTIMQGCVMSSSSSRLTALGGLSKIAQLGQPKKTNPQTGPLIFNIMAMPANLPQDQWEQHAIDNQDDLKRSVTVDV